MGRCFFSLRSRRASLLALLSLLLLPIISHRLGLAAFENSAIAELPPVGAEDCTDLENLQGRFQSVVSKVSPAVVAISASLTADASPAILRAEEMNPDKLQALLAKTTRMVGTGFLIDSDGYILTNDHVIDDAEQLWITTDDKKVYPALVIGSDPRSDLAVLKIPAKNLPSVHFSKASAVRRGQWSIAVGNPYGLSAEGEMCVSVGVISATNRSLPKLSDKENRLYSNLIQTTAQINPGNSGGPLFDLNGEVIGVNTAVIMPQKSTNGIGFALPIDAHFLDVVQNLKQGKEIVYGYLGVIVSTPTDRDRHALGMKQCAGARIDAVEPNSPAADKLVRDDLIVAIDDQAVTDAEGFTRLIGASPVNRPVKVSISRDGKTSVVCLTLQKRQLPIAAITRDNQRLRWGGMLLGPLPATGAISPGPGLMVFGIDPASPFTKLGIHEGSIIKSVAGQPVNGMTDLQGIINDTPPERCEIGLAADVTTAALPTDH